MSAKRSLGVAAAIGNAQRLCQTFENTSPCAVRHRPKWPKHSCEKRSRCVFATIDMVAELGKDSAPGAPALLLPRHVAVAFFLATISGCFEPLDNIVDEEEAKVNFHFEYMVDLQDFVKDESFERDWCPRNGGHDLKTTAWTLETKML